MSVKLSVVVFLLSFIVSLASVSRFNHYYAEQALVKDGQQLLFEFHETLVAAGKILADLPDPQTFRCNANTSAHLIEQAFEHPSIRLLGVLHGEQEYCANSTATMTLSNLNYHDLGNNYQLASATHGKDRHDLLLVRSHGNSRYFADLNPFQVNHISAQTCNKCLTYQIKIIGQPDLVFAGPPLAEPSYLSVTSGKSEGLMQVALTLHATRAFFNAYKAESWLTTVAFSFVVALLLSLFCYKLLSKRQSFRRVLLDAIKYSEFEPFYQPIIDSRTQKVLGAEMLIRWRKKNGTIVPPNQFIPFAEDSGLIVDITEQATKKVVQDIVTLGWHKTERFISINIVPVHIQDEQYFQLLTGLMAEHKLKPKHISLEITERLQIDDLHAARHELDKFFDYGIELKLDDAGTGYGGFSYVQELGVKTLKIDKMFIDTINANDVKASVLEAIISFAASSALHTIAEGVEEEAQVTYLAEHGVYAIQGYVYAKPMAKVDLLTWLEGRG